jgi:ParB family chromosome partitioning protein
MMQVEKIYVDGVTVGDRLRPVDEAHVATLMRSMADIGLQTPISVRMINYNTPTEKYVLVSGLHRLLAAQRLNWDEIDCFITEIDDLKARLLEIVENLARLELTVAERAHHIAEAVRIREAITQRDDAKPRQVDEVSKHMGGRGRKGGISEVARDLNLPEAKVRRALKIDCITHEAKAAAAEAGIADNQAALLRVANRPADEQVGAVAAIVTARAHKAPASTTAQDDDDLISRQRRQLADLEAAWERANSAVRRTFFRRISAEAPELTTG